MTFPDTEIVPIKEDYEIIFTHEQEEIQRCTIYLKMRDEKKTMDEIGIAFGYKGRAGMNKLRDRWIADGIMEKARRKYFVPKGEEIKVAISAVMDSVPAFLARMTKIVLLGREKNAIEAYKLLQETIIQPELNKQPDSEKLEQEYAKRSDKGIHNPMQINLPELRALRLYNSSVLESLESLPTIPEASELDDQSSDSAEDSQSPSLASQDEVSQTP